MEEEGEIYQTYGKTGAVDSGSPPSPKDAKIRNLFRSYDSVEEEQRSPKQPVGESGGKPSMFSQNDSRQYLSLSIDVIHEEKESPSASQVSCISNQDSRDAKDESPSLQGIPNSDDRYGTFAGYTMKSAHTEDIESQSASLVGSNTHNENDLDCNISVTVSNHLESPESQKELGNAQQLSDTPEQDRERVFTMKRAISNEFEQFELPDSNVATNNQATGQKSIFKNDNIFSNFYNCNNFKLNSEGSE